ncbi:hypothetical protein AB0J80_20280 [Actinoplanes sp. NPDC049548]|uniref:hypothetical protein n=1 Tax=Actinoplanes sp. NPDC049548 TaxID=3155152 RepID=UPI003433287C
MIEPVFVDRTGRRRRVMAVAGSAGTLVLALLVLALVAGFTGGGPLPLPGWADSGGEHLRNDDNAKPTPPPTPSRRPTRHVADAAPTPRGSHAATTRPAPAESARPSASAAPVRTSHRRIPTHTPTAPPGKKH